MSLQSSIVSQFARPHGMLGRLAGLIMANRHSNRMRNNWTVDLLALQPSHRVLKIGCGPGLALKACATHLTDGRVVGLDHSEVMVEASRSRLRAELGSGRAEVRLGDLSDIACEQDTYDRIFSLNVVQFFPDIQEGFELIHRSLKARGIVATTFQPRSRRPTRENALQMATRIEAAMKGVGFSQIAMHELPLNPVSAVCVTGSRESVVS